MGYPHQRISKKNLPMLVKNNNNSNNQISPNTL